MRYQGRYSQQPKKKKLNKGIFALIVIFALLLILFLGGLIYANSMLSLIRRPEENMGETLSSELERQMIGNITEASEPQPGEATAPAQEPEEEAPIETEKTAYQNTGKLVNIMLVGQAARDLVEGAKLSDTMMLFTLNKETGELTVTSFLRDTYVQLAKYPGHTVGMSRLNNAYALGYSWDGDEAAIYMLSKTIELNFGSKIDFTVEVSFDSFVTIINELGGVTVELDEDEAKYMTELSNATRSFTAGSVTLNGTEALGYARMRHATAADSDMNRVSRQQKVVSSILEQCRGMSLGQLNSLMKTVLPQVMTDMTNADIRSLALEVLPMVSKLTMVSNQCPAEGTYYGQIIDIAGTPSAVLMTNLQENKNRMTAITEIEEDAEE